MVVREADNPVGNTSTTCMMPRSNSPVLGQSTFDWKATNIYQELCNFETEVKNIFMTIMYNTDESDRVPIIVKWLCWKGLRYV